MVKETKYDYLNSYFLKYKSVHDKEVMYFVTVQPEEIIWEEAEARSYIAQLMPGTTYIVQLEHNYETHHRSATLEEGLHLHLIVAGRYLTHLKELVYYKTRDHLKKLKKAAGVSSFHIVAREVYSKNWADYLSKQLNQLMPYLQVRIKPKKPVKIKDPLKINSVFWSYQMTCFNTTAKKISGDKYHLRSEEKLHLFYTNRKLGILIQVLDAPTIMYEEKYKFAPYKPNAPGQIRE